MLNSQRVTVIQQVFSSKFSTGAALAVVATELEAQAALVA